MSLFSRITVIYPIVKRYGIDDLAEAANFAIALPHSTWAKIFQ
jgi:hypothetical protein